MGAIPTDMAYQRDTCGHIGYCRWQVERSIAPATLLPDKSVLGQKADRGFINSIGDALEMEIRKANTV